MKSLEEKSEMPVSDNQGKSQIKNWIETITPKHNKVLDLAVGQGTYLNLFKNLSNLKECEWYGIEVWPEWASKYNLKAKYDHFYLDDIRTFDYDKIGKVDIAFAGDVIEHMTKEEAISLVNKLVDIADNLYLSIPIIYSPQGPYEGNPYEIHVKPDWSNQEVLETFPYIRNFWAGNVIGVYHLNKS